MLVLIRTESYKILRVNEGSTIHTILNKVMNGKCSFKQDYTCNRKRILYSHVKACENGTIVHSVSVIAQCNVLPKKISIKKKRIIN